MRIIRNNNQIVLIMLKRKVIFRVIPGEFENVPLWWDNCKVRSIYMTWWMYLSQILWFLVLSPKLFSGWDENFGSEMYFQNWRGRKKCDWLGWDSLGPAKRQKDEKAEICWRGWQTQFVLSILFSLLFIFSQTHSLQKDFYKKRHRHRFHIQNTLRTLNLNCKSLNT